VIEGHGTTEPELGSVETTIDPTVDPSAVPEMAAESPAGSVPADGAAGRVRVLVVDDEESITDVISVLLRHLDFEVETAATGREALDRANRERPDLIVLDVMLPDIDGFEVCRRLRSGGVEAPVIFLTALDKVTDKVTGLELGGDDYLTKPFSLDELVARVKAHIRRSVTTTPDDERLRYGDLELDSSRHQVWRGGTLVELSRTEFNLLRFLLVNADHVLSKDQIREHVWGWDFDTDSTVVETYISYLRRKLDPLGPPIIQTVRGVGYTLRSAGES
jgi:two-component system OmpR family response regulator